MALRGHGDKNQGWCERRDSNYGYFIEYFVSMGQFWDNKIDEVPHLISSWRSSDLG